jgi:hypothetical protein
MSSPSLVQTPPFAHSVRLLLLLMLIVQLYFIAVLAVQETSAVNRIGSFKKLLSPPIGSKCPPQKLTLQLFLMGVVKCHLQYVHLMEFSGAQSLPKTFTLMTSLVVTLVFLSQELKGLHPSFVCLVAFHSKSSPMLDYQQYMMLNATMKN